MSRYTTRGAPEQPRRTFETPKFVYQEHPEHIARSCAAIRARRLRDESLILINGEWQ